MRVSEKMGGALGRKICPAQKKKYAPFKKNIPHSNGYWVFIYSGRGQSTFDYSTVTSRNPLQLLEQPRLLSGGDVWPLGCYGLVFPYVNTKGKKFYNQKD